MSTTSFDQRTTKSKFEEKLVRDFGIDNLVRSPYTEFIDGKRVNMSLYYVSEKHVGTWQGGRGWIFRSAYNTVTA